MTNHYFNPYYRNSSTSLASGFLPDGVNNMMKIDDELKNFLTSRREMVDLTTLNNEQKTLFMLVQINKNLVDMKDMLTKWREKDEGRYVKEEELRKKYF